MTISITYLNPVGFNVNGGFNAEKVSIELVATTTDVVLPDMPEMTSIQFNQLFTSGESGEGSIASGIKSRLESNECKSLLLAEINKAIPDDKHWVSMYFLFDHKTFASNMGFTEFQPSSEEWVEGGEIQFVFEFKNTAISISKTISVNYSMIGPGF